MKRKSIAKVLAMALAITLAAAPMSAITAHAGNNGINDGCVGESGQGIGGAGHISFDDDDDDGTITEDLGRQEAATFNAGSDSGSSSDSDNGGNSSYSNSSSGSADNGGSYAGGSESTDSGNGQASAPTGLALKGSTVSVPGYETWRQIANPASGTFSVYHCGIEQYTLQIKDADGKAASYKSAALLQTEDGKWYINITTANGAQISTKKGTADYLPKLGIAGVMLNSTVAVDAAN